MNPAHAGELSSSSTSTGEEQGRVSEPESPSPDENRGRSRARSVPSTTLDAEGYHSFNSMGRRFTVEKRWNLVREMGVGAFGVVVSARDDISGEHVAIKQINRVFDKAALAKRTLREITLLRHFQAHPNIAGLIDLDALSMQSNEIYIFMEPMEADLHQIVRSGQELTNDHIAYFIFQIISGMKFIHACKVMHRDLKPGNILVNATCDIRICDFGLARGYEAPLTDGQETVSQLTDYVATRWYRAPEIMLGFNTYTDSIDIWSIGCICGELINGKPLFQGKDYVDQLKCIFENLGSPSEQIVHRIARGRARKYIRSLPIWKQKAFKDFIPRAEEQAIDLISKMVTYEPEKRISAAQALEHPYLAAFYDAEEEASMPAPQVFSRWREIEELETIEEFRIAVWNEIQDYRAQARSIANIDQVDLPVETKENGADVNKPEVEDNFDINDGLIMASSLIVPPTPKPSVLLPAIDEDTEAVAIPRPARTSYNDTYGTFSRRSSAIFASQSPVSGNHAPIPSNSSYFAQFPTLEANDDTTPSIAVPVRSRVPSMVDGSQFRHLRTLSTVSIHESGSRPGGLAAIAPIGKFVGAAPSAGADAPPSTPPTKIRGG